MATISNRTTGRAVYRNCNIGEIRVERESEFIELRVPGGEQYLRPGEAWGDVDVLALQREMIPSDHPGSI